MASQFGYLEIAQSLVAHGANINAVTGEETSLMMAARNGHRAVVDILLSRGADMEIQDRHGSTALMMAAQIGHQGIVEVLIERGARINAENKRGWTALRYARACGHSTIADLLRAHGAKE